MADWQAVLVGGGALVTAMVAAYTGIRIGNADVAKRRSENTNSNLELRSGLEIIEQKASIERVEAIREDAERKTKLLRDMEERHFSETTALYVRMRIMQKDLQRGWDLGRHYFGLTTNITHIVNNFLQIVEFNPGDDRVAQDHIVKAARNLQVRMRMITVPVELEDAIPVEGK